MGEMCRKNTRSVKNLSETVTLPTCKSTDGQQQRETAKETAVMHQAEGLADHREGRADKKREGKDD